MTSRGELRWRVRRRSCLVFALFLVAAFLFAMLAPARALASDGHAPAPELGKWDDLSGKKVGLLTGASFENQLREKCPNVGDISYFSTMSDMITAL